MKTITFRIALFMILAGLMLAACGPPADVPETPATLAVSEEPSIPTETPEVEQGMPIEPGRNVLVLIEGEARITHDNGGSWTATGTGQYLEAGDQIQLTSDGLALVFFFNGAIIRLEGATDFQLQLAELDGQAGATRIITKLWEGYALFETNPLPTPDSVFQLYAMTSFIDVDYDADLAEAVGGAYELDDERSIIAGGSLDDEDEALHIYRGPATIYVLGWDDYDEDYVAEVHPSRPDHVIEVEIDFFVDPRLEANVEGFLDIAGTLVRQYMQSGEVGGEGLLGYTLDEVEILNSGETTIFFLSGFEGQGLVTDFDTNEESRVNLVVTASLEYVNGFPRVANVEVLILTGDDGFGCDLSSGVGCQIPEGCDLDSGENCDLPGGCNPVTKQGCAQSHVSCEIVVQTDNLGSAVSAELVCPESVQLDCDPNRSGDCDDSYDEAAWADRDDDDGDVEWCWCRATVPPGFPPPPSWMDMMYRCWCSDPGAMRTKPE